MISLSPYLAILSRRDLRGAIFASILGRLPIGITGLSILLLAQTASGTFTGAGSVAAFYLAGLAVAAPVLGRLIDRIGPRLPLKICAVLYPSALVGLVLSFAWGAPIWLVFTCATLTGASFPPITVSMRAFLRQSLADDGQLTTAYSIESVLMEVIFIVGPVIVALFVAILTPSAAVLFAAGAGALGAVLFLRSPALRHWRTAESHTSSLLGPLATPGFPFLLAMILAYSTAFGLVEIGVTAFATEAGRPPLAGINLGLMSLGSAIGGLAYGGHVWRKPLWSQFVWVLAIMGLGIAPLAFLSNALLFSLGSLLAGVVMAPALTIQAMLVSKTSAGGQSTEAFTWSSTGLLAGVGAGLALGGLITEAVGAYMTFVAAALACCGSAATIAIRNRTRRSSRD